MGNGTDLRVYSQGDLDVISHRINTTPRRIFQWESAAGRYNAAVVALTVSTRPLSNFGISQLFKTWGDRVLTDPRFGQRRSATLA